MLKEIKLNQLYMHKGGNFYITEKFGEAQFKGERYKSIVYYPLSDRQKTCIRTIEDFKASFIEMNLPIEEHTKPEDFPPIPSPIPPSQDKWVMPPMTASYGVADMNFPITTFTTKGTEDEDKKV